MMKYIKFIFLFAIATMCFWGCNSKSENNYTEDERQEPIDQILSIDDIKSSDIVVNYFNQKKTVIKDIEL